MYFGARKYAGTTVATRDKLNDERIQRQLLEGRITGGEWWIVPITI
jgi:hypothetical protein